MLSSRGSSQPRDQTQVSCTAGRFFNVWVTREVQQYVRANQTPNNLSASMGACKSLDWCDLTAPSLSLLPTYAETIHPQTLYIVPKNISRPSNSLHPMVTMPSKSKSPGAICWIPAMPPAGLIASTLGFPGPFSAQEPEKWFYLKKKKKTS